MTAAPSLDEYNVMDFSSLEDKMEMGSSPYPHVDGVEDLDFEFDRMENQPPAPPTDNLMNDAIDQGNIDNKTAQYQDVEFFSDVDTDEPSELIQPDSDDAKNDFIMDEPAGNNSYEDEEILYDEEEDPTVVADKTGPGEEDPYPQTQDDDIEEFLEPDKPFDQSHPDQQEMHATIKAVEDTENPVVDTYQDLQQDTGDQQISEEQYEQDDGDGPSVEPTATEIEPDPDTAPPASGEEVELQVEEGFADDLNVRDGHVITEQQEEVESAEGVPYDANSGEQFSGQETSYDLHPVTFSFFEQDFVLFPPSEVDAAVALFPNTSLAYQPIDQLLKATLPKLPLPEHFRHHDELVLSVTELGLQISEDSKFASEITLAQIVDLFCSLHHNENLNPSAPMRCDLVSRTCIRTQFQYLGDSLQAGATYSGIAAEHAETPAAAEAEAEDVPYDDDAVQQSDAAPVEATAGQDKHEQELQDQYVDDGNLDQAETEANTENASGTLFEDIEAPVEEDYAGDEATGLEPQDEHLVQVDGGPTGDVGSGQADNEAQEPPVEIEVSEFFEEALDEQAEAEAEEEAEDYQEQSEDQSVLREAVSAEQTETQALLEDEISQDRANELEAEFDADEFFIESDVEVSYEAAPEQDHAQSNGKSAPVSESVHDGQPAAFVPASTPTKRSKRKVSDAEEDFIIETDTPEPKRRRPS